MTDENNNKNSNISTVVFNDLLSLILKLISSIYYIGIFFSALIFISYFIYIKYIPNISMGLIFMGFIFIVLIISFFGAILLITGFPGLYYLMFTEEQLKNQQRELNYEGKGFDEKIINKYRIKFFLLNSITIAFYVFILSMFIHYFYIFNSLPSHFDHIILIIILFLIPFLLFFYLMCFFEIEINSSSKIKSLKFKFNLYSFFKRYTDKRPKIIKGSESIAFMFIYFIYILFLTLFVIKFLPIFFKLLHLSLPFIINVLIFDAALVALISLSNLILFDITALFKNRENLQYNKKYKFQDISVPLIIFLLVFIFFKLYKYPFYYFKLGSFQKKIIVNKMGLSFLKSADYPNKLISPYIKKDTYCKNAGSCFKVKSFILSDIGRDVYLNSNFKFDKYKKNQKINTVYDQIPKKDFLFKSYKNYVANTTVIKKEKNNKRD